MNDILISPLEIREIAEKLRTHGNNISQALLNTDDQMANLSTEKFDGWRASSLQNRYLELRVQLLESPGIITAFSKELDEIAAMLKP